MRFTKLSEITNYAYIVSQDLFKALINVGGWRGLFDNCGDEFNKGTIAEKWAVIQELKDFCECDLDELLTLYMTDCILSIDREHCVISVPATLYYYGCHYTEAREVLIKRATQQSKDDTDFVNWKIWASKWFVGPADRVRRIDEPFEQSQWT